MDKLIEHLKSTSVSDSYFDRMNNIVTITTETRVVEAIEVLNKHQISSVPVLRPQDGKLVGIIDTFNIIGFALEIFPNEADLEEDFFRSFLHSNFELETRKVSDILNKEYSEEMFSMTNADSVYAVAEILGNGIHRLPILDVKRNTLVNIVSQSNVIKFILKNIHLAPKLGNATLDQLGLAEKELLTAKDSERVIDVLHLLLGTKFSAILCFDHNNLPSISLSANDVRNLEKDSFASMFFSVKAYFQQMDPKRRRKLLCCSRTSTFEQVLHLLVDNQVHRLWVQETDQPNSRVIGVVTMTDLLERILFPLEHTK